MLYGDSDDGGSTTTGCRVPSAVNDSSDDPFKDIWDPILVPLLEKNPKLLATTLLQHAQDIDPVKYPDKLIRTLQRRVQRWKAIHAP